MNNRKIAQLNINLPVLLKKEGTAFVAYTPALDISTYGSTKGEAKKSFNELVTVFFEEFIDNPDGLDVVLDSLGWTKQKNNWQPPKIENTMQNVRVSFAA